MKNIVLMGFMGTGKTTVGKMIASKTGMRYCSSDNMIEKSEGMPIPDIFTSRGEPYFREKEIEIISRLALTDNSVIDTGGGVPLFSENIKRLRQNSMLVCLWSDPEDICKRTKDNSNRPLLNVSDPVKKIDDLLTLRKPYYESADYHVNTSAVSAEEASRLIINFFKKVI